MDYPQDPRTVNMVRGFGPNHEPLPITREALVDVTKEWPLSEHTPEAVAEQLRVSRDLFVHCLLVWEFGTVGVAWSLMAVESCLRWALDAGEDNNVGLGGLVKRAQSQGLLSEGLTEALGAGVRLRNGFSHPRMQPVWSLGMTAPALRTSHLAVYEFSEAIAALPRCRPSDDG